MHERIGETSFMAAPLCNAGTKHLLPACFNQSCPDGHSAVCKCLHIIAWYIKYIYIIYIYGIYLCLLYMSSKMLHNWGLWQLGHTSFLDFPAAVQCTAMGHRGHRGHLAIRMQRLCLAFKKLIWAQFQLRIWDLRDLTWPLVSQESRAPRSSASKCYTQCKDASSTQHQQRPYYNWRKNVQRWQLRKPWPGDNLS